MSLSSELISQFVKATKDETKNQNGTTVHATTVLYNGKPYVRLDGSDLLTPVNTTADVKDGERVSVLIQNHTATVTGNMSSPAARTDDVKDIDGKVEEAAKEITEFQIIMAAKVNATDLEAINATIESLKAKTAHFDNMEAVNADITKLQAKYAELEYVDAKTIDALNADIENLRAKIGTFTDISTEDLEAMTADIDNLRAYNAEFTYVSADVLEAIKANIKELEVKKLTATEADLKYANIDFSNIKEAAIEKIFTDSGIIKDLIVSEGKITGELVGVTIKGDIIEGGTVKADKLVVKGSDGLFYKLNVDGGATTSEQISEEDLQNGLSGSVIVAKSITAEKVAVDDLVAFGATIGGFHITEDTIYSGVKESPTNATRGIYLDNTGQIGFGDSNDYLRYFQDTDGTWKLEISAGTIKMSSSNKTIEDIVGEAQKAADAAITNSVEQFYQSTSPTSLVGGSWSLVQPTWTEGTYIWRRTKNTYGSGEIKYSPSETGVCITGNTGAQGEKGDKGDTGDTGKGISKTEVYYYLSTSNTSQTGGSWSTTVPSWVDGRYYWQKIKTTYTDNTTAESTPVCITGAKGSTGGTGATGTGVESITTEFYLSTSKTSQSGGSWGATMPTWSSGKYLWTRNKIVYKNPSSTVYTTPVCDSSWEAVNDIQVGGRNLWENGDFSKDLPVGNISVKGPYEIVELAAGNVTGFGKALHLNSSYSRVICTRFSAAGEELIGKILTMQCWIKYSDVVLGSNYWNQLNVGKYSLVYELEDGTKTSANYSSILPSFSGTSDGWVQLTGSITLRSDVVNVSLGALWIGLEDASSGEAWVTGIKLEYGNKATDWTPAPEDVEQSITNVSSQYTQLADKFNWIVKSGTSSSDFTITDRLISLTSTALNIDALTTFKNSAENGTSTVINGGSIKTNTITTAKLATDAIKSTNYSYSSGNFSSAGTFLDLSTGLVRSKNFGIDSSGNVYLKGNIQANAGYIGGTSGWAITTNTITGNANSKIISGILESSNFVENSTGVQMNLNTGIIKGNIEASTLAAKDALQIYVGNTKRNVMTGYVGNGFFYTTLGCDLTIGDVSKVKPSITICKEISNSQIGTPIPDVIYIDATYLDIEANTSIVGSLSASDISTYTNGGTWISGKTSAAINVLTTQSESSFHPVLRIQSYSGNVWCLGGLGDTIGIYGYQSGRTDNGYDWCTTWNTSNGRMYVNSLNVDGFLFGQIIELSATTPYIDFHYGNSGADFTSRIVAVNNGILDIQQSGQWGGIRMDSTIGHIFPLGNGNYSLGHSSYRFSTLYTINGVNNSSLIELKTQINPFASALSEIEKTDVFNYKLKANIKRNGDDIIHTGFVIGDGYNCSDYLISESRDGIDLYSAIGVTFGGVKELYEIVKQQQKTIEELKERLHDK